MSGWVAMVHMGTVAWLESRELVTAVCSQRAEDESPTNTTNLDMKRRIETNVSDNTCLT